MLAERDATVRLFTGAVGCLYLAAWATAGSGELWSQHVGWLDALLTSGCLWIGLKLRIRHALALPLATFTHLAVMHRAGWIPQSDLQWGAMSVGVGFGLLALSLTASVRWAHNAASTRPRTGS